MPSESKNWRPAQWSATKRASFEMRVYHHMEQQLILFLDPYAGALRVAELRAQARAAESLARLRNTGVRTLGEVDG